MKKKSLISILITIPIIVLGIYLNNSNDYRFKYDTEAVISADYPQYTDADNLVENSDLVFTGTVKSISYEMIDIKSEEGADSVTGLVDAEPLPYSIYEIEVNEIYKDIKNEYSKKPKTIFLKSLGGIVDNTNYKVENSIVIIEKQSYLFTTKTFEDSYPSLLNVNQSVYNLNSPIETKSYSGDIITLNEILEIVE